MSLLSFHIPFERLVDLVEARLPREEAAAIRGHVSTCQRCTQEVTRLERLIGVMRSDQSIDAPSSVLARALRLFRPQVAPTPESPLRRILAILRFDNAPMSPALGMRSEGATARQFLFAAGEYDVDIRITPAGDGWQVTGQVLGESDASGQVALAGTTGTTQATLNDQSEFMLPPVVAGQYQLTFQLRDVEIAVEVLQVGHEVIVQE